MGLIRNGFRESTGKFIGASLLNAANPYVSIPWAQITNRKRNSLLSYPTQSAIPNGHLHPSAWALPNKAGGMSSYQNVTGSGTITADILSVKLMEAAISGDGSLTAFGSLVVQMLADITGSGTISNADLKAFLQMAASLSGNGGISDAQIQGFAELIASLTGTGTLDDSVISGIAELVADLVVTGTGLTTSNVGQAVWSAVASANNDPGTMGEKLNDAGSASNPWTETIEGTYTAAEIMRIVLSVLAGKTNINGTTVTFRDINDIKDRVTAEMTGSERTSITLDGSE